MKEEVIELLRQKGCKTSLELESHDVLSRVKYEDYEGSQVSADLSELDRNTDVMHCILRRIIITRTVIFSVHCWNTQPAR